jgi:hypothetical protein
MNDKKCYDCIYRRSIPGDAHSSCVHPETGMDKSDFPMFDGLVGLLGIGKPAEAIIKLNIKADPIGIRHGWFMWPGNFDPTWLINCDGFIEKEKKK